MQNTNTALPRDYDVVGLLADLAGTCSKSVINVGEPAPRLTALVRMIAALLMVLALLGWGARVEATVPQECSLSADTNPQPNEGPTDELLYLPSKGTLNAVMIFVDFPDAPQSETTRSLYNLLVPDARRWYREVSYGQLKLRVTRSRSWYRMPKSSIEYGFADGVTFEEHRAYIADAIAVSDLNVDYSQYDLAYIVSSQGAELPISPTFTAFPGSGVLVDGSEVRHAVTFGSDIRVPRPNYGAHVLVHETGHLLGLPDLYEFGAEDLFDALRFGGGWDVMSWVAPGAHFLLWHKLKLGWLKDDQITCVSSGQITETITPVEVARGLKGIVVRISPTRAYVIEVRQLIGQDRRLCDQGALIYTVDAATPNGSGPVIVQPAQTGTDSAQVEQCGPLYDAPFDIGLGEVSLFSDTAVGMTVELVSRNRKTYVVRVTKE